MLSSTENSAGGGRYLLLIPPMTQLNTPYPSTAYLTGFLRSQGLSAVQEDLALALVLRVLSADGLQRIAGVVKGDATTQQRPATTAFLGQLDDYVATIDRVISFLQGRDSTLAHRIAARTLLPEGPRFASLDVFEGDEDSGEDALAWA
ncbi:MAG TPA: radical SAM protein, partial [Planctomycetaceae bacterium]|nr:radical SAM protein [Planctomycetaceae bacterium]